MRNFRIEIKWAIIFSIVSLFWMILEKLVGLHGVYVGQQPIYTIFFAFPAILIYILALTDKKKNYFFDKMNWAQGFVTGTIISLGISILSPFVQYITFEFISPDYFDNAIANAVVIKSRTEESAKAFFNLRSFIIQGFLGSISLEIVTGGIVAYFLQTKDKIVLPIKK
jgi:membrane protease YdiL (CAAX protease family)